MCPQAHDSSGSADAAPGPLDEFAHEDRADEAGETPQAPASVLAFDVTPALPALDQRRPALSRLESLARRRRHHRLSYLRRLVANAGAARDRIGRACAAIKDTILRGTGSLGRTVARVTPRATQAAKTASRRAMFRVSSLVTARPWPSHAPLTAAPIATALEYQEMNRFAAAVLLALAVAGSGLLVPSWRGPAELSIPPAQTLVADLPSDTPAPPVDVSAPAIEPVPRAPQSMSAVLPATRVTTIAARRDAFTPSPSTVTAMWRRRDTRSLERAFSSLRGQTLAFHRCGMRVTSADRAVARCEGVATAAATRSSRRATWTINFRRTAGRWVIANVAMR